jgi:hypothetical protein
MDRGEEAIEKWGEMSGEDRIWTGKKKRYIWI